MYVGWPQFVIRAFDQFFGGSGFFGWSVASSWSSMYLLRGCLFRFVSFRPEWMKPFVSDNKSKRYTTSKFWAWISLHISRNLGFGPFKKKKKKKNMHRERGHGCRKERKIKGRKKGEECAPALPLPSPSPTVANNHGRCCFRSTAVAIPLLLPLPLPPSSFNLFLDLSIDRRAWK